MPHALKGHFINYVYGLIKLIITPRKSDLKGVFAKNEKGYSDKKALLIATNLTSIC